MKTLPFWVEGIKDKAIFIAAGVSLANRAINAVDVSRFYRGNQAADRTLPEANAVFDVPSRAPFRLQSVSIVFIIAELLDLATTAVGLLVIPGIWEANPMVAGLGGWMQALLLKLAAVALIVSAIEVMNRPLQLGSVRIFSGKLPKAVWMIPVIAGLPMLWNILVIILEQIY